MKDYSQAAVDDHYGVEDLCLTSHWLNIQLLLGPVCPKILYESSEEGTPCVCLCV